MHIICHLKIVFIFSVDLILCRHCIIIFKYRKIFDGSQFYGHCWTLHENCPYSELFWSAFSHIRTEYGEIRSISPYSVQMRENADQITPNTDIFHVVRYLAKLKLLNIWFVFPPMYRNFYKSRENQTFYCSVNQLNRFTQILPS